MSDLRGEKRSIDNDNGKGSTIELLDNFLELRQSWPKDMGRLFDPALDDDRRPALWEMMCENGDALRQRFSWAIPDERALRVLKHFSPIVEIGSGLGYWAMLLRARGADIRAYDKISGAPGAENPPAKKRPKSGESKDSAVQNGKGDDGSGESEDEDTERLFWTEVEEGGPDVLEEACNQDRSLFLCYPDDFEGGIDSLGLECIQSFDGDVVIHVGELFGDSVCMTPHQAPWGRTTSRECQEELATNFHCILKVPLPSWPHSRDTMTVWKRNKFSPIRYGSDVDEDEEQKENSHTGKKDTSESGNGAATAGVSSEKEVEEGRCSGDDDDGSEEDISGSSLDGFPDLDIYAYVPPEEQILSAQAAPSIKFLLDE